MTKRLLLLATLLATGLLYVLVPAAAQAHPLGNFTINRFARVEVAGHRLYVRYVVDMAEIPTLQQVRVRIGGLRVRLDGHPARLRVTRTALAHPRGAAGLQTTRFQAILAGPRVDKNVHVVITDYNYADRIGWKEIVVGAHTRSASDELRAYPKDLLRSPLDVTHVTATLAPTHDVQPTLLTGRALAAPDRVADSRFASLIGRGHLSALVVLGSLLGIHTSLFVGGAVALSAGVYAWLRVPAVVSWRAPSRPHLEEGEPVLSPTAGVTTLR